MAILQGTATQSLKFFLEDPDNPGVGVEGLEAVVDVKIRKEGASAAVTPQGAVREVPGIPGAYEVAPNADDADTAGEIMLFAEAPGALNDIQAYEVVTNTAQQTGNGISPPSPGAS